MYSVIPEWVFVIPEWKFVIPDSIGDPSIVFKSTGFPIKLGMTRVHFSCSQAEGWKFVIPEWAFVIPEWKFVIPDSIGDPSPVFKSTGFPIYPQGAREVGND